MKTQFNARIGSQSFLLILDGRQEPSRPTLSMDDRSVGPKIICFGGDGVFQLAQFARLAFNLNEVSSLFIDGDSGPYEIEIRPNMGHVKVKKNHGTIFLKESATLSELSSALELE